MTMKIARFTDGWRRRAIRVVGPKADASAYRRSTRNGARLAKTEALVDVAHRGTGLVKLERKLGYRPNVRKERRGDGDGTEDGAGQVEGGWQEQHLPNSKLIHPSLESIAMNTYHHLPTPAHVQPPE